MWQGGYIFQFLAFIFQEQHAHLPGNKGPESSNSFNIHGVLTDAECVAKEPRGCRTCAALASKQTFLFSTSEYSISEYLSILSEYLSTPLLTTQFLSISVLSQNI